MTLSFWLAALPWIALYVIGTPAIVCGGLAIGVWLTRRRARLTGDQVINRFGLSTAPTDRVPGGENWRLDSAR